MKTRIVSIGVCLFTVAAGCGPKRGSSASPVPGSVDTTADFGLDKPSAVRVCGPAGERDYLDRLRCASGEVPSYGRVGSVGQRNPGDMDLSLAGDMDAKLPEGMVDAHIVDLYEVRCGEATLEVFFDMYHCSDPDPLSAVGALSPAEPPR